MIQTLAKRVVDSFALTSIQKQAALERERDVVVTAGAGSGKTRTLVARDVSLLAEGLEPRRVIAITFTKKTAREMRSRVRDALNKLVLDGQSPDEQQMWLSFASRINSARIGTIHSICAEILQAHPAEAGIDPRFGVLDEGLAAALRAQVVEDTLGEFVDDAEFMDIFAILTPSELKDVLKFLISHRLEAGEAFAANLKGNQVVQAFLTRAIQRPELAVLISYLRGRSQMDLTGDGLYDMVISFLALWDSAEAALLQGNLAGCVEALIRARKTIKLNIGKKVSTTKDILKEFQKTYEAILAPLLGGDLPDPETEKRLAIIMPLIERAYEKLSRNYRAALDERQMLDFDDLESGAEKLLRNEAICGRWQSELDALLVDEFQDTNARQRAIVEALAGVKGHLFVVGDERQSIYRFRRADVTVFRAIRQKVALEGGLHLDLDRTYRAHEPLLQGTGDLLKGIMGDTDDPARPYYVPFSQLDADRKFPPEYIQAPHIELVLGAGEDAADARPVMAMALGKRLLELKKEGQIRKWDDVVLLFRASSGFVYYEDAFEDLGIPFVTVAGRGFYDRPEIRDVINLLRALADPTDNLVMAGLLRSPAFGLSDASLYMLLRQDGKTHSYWEALQGDIFILNDIDQGRARRALEILQGLIPQVDRIPVAELLKQLVDATDYRAILASGGEGSTSGRLWRNLDKLMSDAQSSGHVNIRDFLDYLDTISDASVREGEAPADAQGALRLMTIHKSKGLEFPVVVLADASRQGVTRSEQAYLLPEIGLALKLTPSPIIYRYAKWQDDQQDDAESKRILYVALTRAKDKLIVSGHVTQGRSGEWKALEWMGEITAKLQLDLDALVGQAGMPSSAVTASGHSVRVIICQDVNADAWNPDIKTPEIAVTASSLYRPLGKPQPILETNDEPEEIYPWRTTGDITHVAPGVIGQMVHKAIELGKFSDDFGLMPMLETEALNAGLAIPMQRLAATHRTIELLNRLQAHPLWEEIAVATERHHEVPYSRMVEDRAETGYIDLLYRTETGWHVVDFKTDSIRSAAEQQELVSQYRRQMNRYADAVAALLGKPPQVKICFLDNNGSVGVVEI